MNPRFEAFMLVNAFNVWRSNCERNAAFMAFISNIKRTYAAARNLDESQPGGAYISDHNDFTQFIGQQVSARHQ
ncbi:hypothetical protein [Serratia fonticola]|uniref:hypothetical protein n=1 Tax=Serratia fonticola TaxID=47917 RepID=UPI00217C5F5E|nr:hypothetical protein [Serratia fonticola]CAI1038385.1 Uncharacterised protein [Serratia fonticola]